MATIDRLLVNERDAAALVGIGVTKFRELVAADEIKALRIGRAVRYSVRSIEEWIGRLEAAS